MDAGFKGPSKSTAGARFLQGPPDELTMITRRAWFRWD